ncbi:MAG: amino acid permease [Candidatus Kapabacteria bacterium]|nr:amino acid permease [Candidatus Kapabacteria bacterium]
MESKPEFKKGMNLIDSTAMVVGSMIGSGIFIVSADMSRHLGSGGWLLIAWGITAIMTVSAALSYGELAAMFPKAGGQYVYLRESYNPFVGFLYGWTFFAVIQTGTIAAVAVAFGSYMGVIFPWFSQTNILLDIGFIKFNTVQLLAIAMIIALTLINLRGISLGKLIQNIFTLTKVAALLVLIIVGWFFFNDPIVNNLNSKTFWEASTLQNNILTPISGLAVIAALGMAMTGSVFSADAWNNITFTAGEVKNPKRNIPLSLFFGTLLVMILYMLANLVYINVLPVHGESAAATAFERGLQFATSDRVGTAVMSRIFSSSEIVMALLIIVSTFGCNNGLVISGARVYYAMANDKLFFKGAATLNQNGVPANSLQMQCLWACILCLSGTYGNLLDYIVIAVLIFYILTLIGIFILRRTKPEYERPYRAFGFPVLPFIYIILAAMMIIVLLINKPDYTWPGVLIVALGAPIYIFIKK